MEELAEVAQKDYEKLLLELRREHGESNPLHIRRSRYKIPQFLKLLDEQIEALQEADFVKVEPYVPPWIMDTQGHRVQNTERKPDSDVMAIHLLPKAEAILKSRTTVTETKTVVQETFQEPEMQDRRKWLRQFVRTDRGNAIITMVPEALVSNIRGHLAALRDPNTLRKERVVHKIWLQYELAWRWDDIPPELRHEMEDYRDLPVTRRKTR